MTATHAAIAEATAKTAGNRTFFPLNPNARASPSPLRGGIKGGGP